MASQARSMRLCEHPDFGDAILRAAEHWRERGLRAAVIEKDYYVTEALREIARAAGPHVIFKGGTSLSKGWGLIDRFSEDVDLFLDPESYRPPLGTKGVDRELKRLRDIVLKMPNLSHRKEESSTFGGSGRSDRFAYPQRFAGVGEVAARVLLESGIASGRQPTEDRALTSLLATYLGEVGVSLQAEDEQPFSMKLLHFRRTFVEKLFAIHGKVEKRKRERTPLGSYARHYYDLYRLAGQPEVLAMLGSDEFPAIQRDYDRISRRHFPRDYACPEGMDFRHSDALFPKPPLRDELGAAYEEQCAQLCYGPWPSWRDVLIRFEELRPLLGHS